MRQTLQTSNHKNQLNNSEKIQLLRLLSEKKLSNKLQAAVYQRWDQTTKENGWAKYMQITENWLYKQSLEIPEEKIWEQINIQKTLEPYDTIIDLWPWWWKTLNYMNKKQLYRPVDVSAYVIDNVSQPYNISTEWTIGDRFNTRVFKESQWKKAYIIGKTIPNLSDSEIIDLTDLLPPTKDGKSTLVVSYFPEFEETQDNIHKLKAIYGDADIQNPYANKDSQNNIGNFVLGLFISLGFSHDTVEQIIEYNKESHSIIVKIKVKKDTAINIDGEKFYWKEGEELPIIQSRRMSDNHVATLLEKSGWKRTKHQKDQRIAVDVFEKTDPQKISNFIWKRWTRLALILWLWTTIAMWYNAYEKHTKNTFLQEKQQTIEKELLLNYNKDQIDYFNKHIEETKQMLKTFYGIQDEGYINGLLRPYMISNPELVDYIMQEEWNYGTISPIGTNISEYVAMMVMKDQEKHNFLEYFGNDKLGYKKFDPYIPNMLQTLQYYEQNPEQELIIPTNTNSQIAPNGMWRNKHEIGSWVLRWKEKIIVFTVSANYDIPWAQKYNNLIATSYIDRGMSDKKKTKVFIQNYLSYRHNTKYLARQASNYINKQLKENNTELNYTEDINRIGTIEHIIQQFVLCGGDTKPYLTGENIGKEVFDKIIYTSTKCVKYFKEHIGIDLENMQKLPEYEQRRGKYALAGWEGSAYRNDPVYQEESKNFFKRD